MAWLEKKGETFRIRFRFGGKHLCSVHTSDQTEAADSLTRFEADLPLIDRGITDRRRIPTSVATSSPAGS